MRYIKGIIHIVLIGSLVAIMLLYPAIGFAKSYDARRVCHAIAIAETGNCTNPNAITAQKRNNCWGIHDFSIKVGNPLRWFPSRASGEAYCENNWINNYNDLPNAELARKYTGHPDANWLAIVLWAYNRK